MQPVNLDRPAAQGAQAGRSASNVQGHIGRFLGFLAAREELADIKALGLFSLLDGPMIMAFIAYQLRERGVALATCVQSTLALTKARQPPAPAPPQAHPSERARAPQGVTFVLSELLGPEVKAAGYLERLQLLGKQLAAWSLKAPKDKPTFKEMVASGSFVPLEDILSRTLPFIAAAVEAFDGSGVPAAQAVRDAVILAAVAGDGNPNERPQELAWVRDGSIQGGCMDPKARGRGRRRGWRRRSSQSCPRPCAVHEARERLPRQLRAVAGGWRRRGPAAAPQDRDQRGAPRVDHPGKSARRRRRLLPPKGTPIPRRTVPRRRRTRWLPRLGPASSPRRHRCCAPARRPACCS